METYKPVNWIKNILLNFYALGMERTMRQNKPAWQKDNIPIILWGVLMSGRMNEERINKLFPAMLAKAEKKRTRIRSPLSSRNSSSRRIAGRIQQYRSQ